MEISPELIETLRILIREELGRMGMAPKRPVGRPRKSLETPVPLNELAGKGPAEVAKLLGVSYEKARTLIISDPSSFHVGDRPKIPEVGLRRLIERLQAEANHERNTFR